MSIFLKNSVYLVYLISLLMSHVPRRKKWYKALLSLQKYDDLHIWMFISLWGQASRNGLIRIFCLRATPCTIIGAKSDTAVSPQEKDEIYDIYSAEGPCENNFCPFDGAGEHAR